MPAACCRRVDPLPRSTQYHSDRDRLAAGFELFRHTGQTAFGVAGGILVADALTSAFAGGEHPVTGLAEEASDRPRRRSCPSSMRQPSRRPTTAFGFRASDHIAEWALDDRLVDLSDAIGHFSDLFDPAQLDRATLLNATTGRKALHGLPMGQLPHLTHVWKSFLEQAGFTLEDIRRDWEAYWPFWCDQVQPAVRQALGRDDVWGVGREGHTRCIDEPGPPTAST